MDERTLATELLRAPSPTGRESPAAEVLLAAFRALDYDRAWIDPAGNVLAEIGFGDGPSVMLNGHIDTVPVGDEGLWPHPPLSGAVVDGELWGRGACDMKSALACMALAGRDLADRIGAGEAGAGRVIVSGVVQEEVGGLGARYLADRIDYDAVVLGEPTGLELKLGHRGRIEIEATFEGRIAHAAKAELGDNALERAARFVAALSEIALPSGGPLGRSTATPTRLETFPDGNNVVPGRATLVIDYRNLPDDPPEAVLARLQTLDPDAVLTVGEQRGVSENGEVRIAYPRVNPPYLAPGEHRAVTVARRVLRELLTERGRPFAEGVWWFATDAPYLARGSVPVLGFGPGDPELAHTTRERVPLDHLAVARRAYGELALALLRDGLERGGDPR